METICVTVACVIAFLVVGFTHWVYKWRDPKCDGILPPGSLGLPLIGETLQLMVPSKSMEMIPFLSRRIQKYGKIFKTSVVGQRIIVSADPKFSHFVLQQDGKLFESWFLDTFAELFKPDDINTSTIHWYSRNMTLRHFGMEALKQKLLDMMEATCREALRDWSLQQGSIDVKYGFATMALEFFVKQLLSYDPKNSPDKLLDIYLAFVEGIMSIPLNIPGTTHYKCLQNQKKATYIIREIVKERLAAPEKSPETSDVLDHIIGDMKKEKFLTVDVVVDRLFGLLFASFDGVSAALTLALKLLQEHPLILQELTDEHEAILRSREDSKSPITWNEYKSMPFTLQVINEVLRLASIAPALFRRTKKDVQFNGYTIPAGWGVMVATVALHLDPDIYEDPTTFNPSRWKDCKSEAMLKNFMPFGWGMRQCAGAEYARVFMAAFLHVLVTGYRWKMVQGGEIYRSPMLNFGKGMHFKFMQKNM